VGDTGPTLDLNELHGLSLVEAIDQLYRRLVDRLAPELVAAWVRHAEERKTLIKRTTDSTFPNMDEAEAIFPKPTHRGFDAYLRLLKEHRWACFSPSWIEWERGATPRFAQAADQILRAATSPIIESLAHGKITATGIHEPEASSSGRKSISAEFFVGDLWVLRRVGWRLIRLTAHGARVSEEKRGYCKVRLETAARRAADRVDVTLGEPTTAGEPAQTVPYRTGAEGRPSSWHLVEPEVMRRFVGGKCPNTPEEFDEFCCELEAWLRKTYPGAPSMTKKTIKNKTRGLWRAFEKRPK
jgi:hypothetical protein